jgi:hypothetical protein
VLTARNIPDRYPLHHIHDYSHQLSGCRFFKIDLARAYTVSHFTGSVQLCPCIEFI